MKPINRLLKDAIPGFVSAVLDGLILSDMSVDKPIKHKSDGLAKCSRLMLQMKHLDVPLFLHNLLALVGVKSNVVRVEQTHKDTSKTYIKFSFRTLKYVEFLELRKRWYRGSRKFVPDDLKLCPISVYFWMLGDGYRDPAPTHKQIRLSTDGFSQHSTLKLKGKLDALLGDTSDLTSINHAGKILVRSGGFDRFMNICRQSNLDFPSYTYKFR